VKLFKPVSMEEVNNYLDSGYPVDVTYLDFQKAFNKVPHQRLLIKLQTRSIGGNETLKILNDFCNINRGLFFNLVDGSRIGQEKKLFKRFHLNIRKNFSVTGCFIIGNHYLQSVLTAELLIRLKKYFPFSGSRNPVLIDNLCDIVESRQNRLALSMSLTVVASVNLVNDEQQLDKICLHIVNEWNKLPRVVTEVTSVNAFKNGLDRHWKDMGVYS